MRAVIHFGLICSILIYLKVSSVEDFLDVEGFAAIRLYLPEGAESVGHNITSCGKNIFMCIEANVQEVHRVYVYVYT